MSVIALAVLALTCYLIGAIPVAWLLTRAATGRDLRYLGSGNVGVMNTALSVGRGAGLVVFLSEAAKGVTAVVLALSLGGEPFFMVAAVLTVVAGTRWPIWLGGSGGRGNTTGMAAVTMISWPTPVLALAFWLVARRLVGSTFLATRLNLIAWPLFFWLATGSMWCLGLGAGLSLIFLHAQRRESDDHLRLIQQFPDFLAFLTSPRRH